MNFIFQILRLCVIMLLTVFGANMAFAMPMAPSCIAYFQNNTTHFAQGDDVVFAARAPPTAGSNVATTGDVTVMHGSTFALHGQETVAALFGFDRSFIAPNTAVVPRTGSIKNPDGVRLSANEQSAADALSSNGYDVNVVQRDLGAEGVRRSDFTVDGFGRVDEYTPTNPTQNTVVRGVVDKIGGGQADSVIVNVPSDFSNVDMYSSAVRVFNNPSASNANTLFFLQNGQLRQFDRSVVNNLIGAN